MSAELGTTQMAGEAHSTAGSATDREAKAVGTSNEVNEGFTAMRWTGWKPMRRARCVGLSIPERSIMLTDLALPRACASQGYAERIRSGHLVLADEYDGCSRFGLVVSLVACLFCCPQGEELT